MREILFRGKRVKKYCETQDWTYGVSFFDHEGDCVFKTACSELVVNPETVGQYTGLTDKNGKEIFEGDICKHRSDYSGEYIISVVAYEDGEFLAMVGNNSAFCLSDKLEVIGNIHDNPELLN